MVQTRVCTSASTKSLAVSFSLLRDEGNAWLAGTAVGGAEDVGWAEWRDMGDWVVAFCGVPILDSNRAIHLEKLSCNRCSGVCGFVEV